MSHDRFSYADDMVAAISVDMLIGLHFPDALSGCSSL